MSRTLAQIEREGYHTLTEEEKNSFTETLKLIQDAVNNQWPKQFGEASDLLLRTYGWHLRLWMHPNDLIPYMKIGDEAVNKYFVKHLRRASFRQWLQAVKRFPNRKRMINKAFFTHWAGNYMLSVPLFLMLSEGIFRELTGEDLFSKKQKSKVSDTAGQNPNIKILPMMSHIINAVSNGVIIGLRFAGDEYLKFPNVLSCNKIMHGADPNYDTKINSYKALSQFEFVMESVHAALTGAAI